MLTLAEEERAYKADMAEMYGNEDDIRSNSNGQGDKDDQKGQRDEEEGGGGDVSTEYICSAGQNTAKSPSPRRRQQKI